MESCLLFSARVLSMGARTDTGIRHAFPLLVVLLSVFVGVAVEMALTSRSRQLKIPVALALLAAAVSALPQIRPWEYLNEFVGGSANACEHVQRRRCGPQPPLEGIRSILQA